MRGSDDMLSSKYDRVPFDWRGHLKHQRIYRDLVQFYDLIYTWKNYQRETADLVGLIKRFKKSDGQDLLEVACGTGEYARFLKDDFTIVGTDISGEALRIARRKVPQAEFKRADMANFDLGRQFDVILCLFSSIGYVRTLRRLRRTMACCAAHLSPGGVLIIEPWLDRKSYMSGMAHVTSYEDNQLKITRMSVSKARGRMSVMDMHYLVARQGKDVRHYVDRHELAMFEKSEMFEAMRSAGLKSRFVKQGLMKGRGLYVGTKA